MDLVSIHECLCDRTRLRIVHLLLGGPLCVCHLQEVLREPQVKISRHLAYLRERGMVVPERCGQWMIYRLPAKRPPALEANLACLQDVAAEEAVFRQDLQRLRKLRKSPGSEIVSCGGPSRAPRRRFAVTRL
jgi:ArsR family transcriptional regulator